MTLPERYSLTIKQGTSLKRWWALKYPDGTIVDLVAAGYTIGRLTVRPDYDEDAVLDQAVELFQKIHAHLGVDYVYEAEGAVAEPEAERPECREVRRSAEHHHPRQTQRPRRGTGVDMEDIGELLRLVDEAIEPASRAAKTPIRMGRMGSPSERRSRGGARSPATPAGAPPRESRAKARARRPSLPPARPS